MLAHPKQSFVLIPGACGQGGGASNRSDNESPAIALGINTEFAAGFAAHRYSDTELQISPVTRVQVIR